MYCNTLSSSIVYGYGVFYPVDRGRTEAPSVAPPFAGQLLLHCHLLEHTKDIQDFRK